jgi:hypothetical protein
MFASPRPAFPVLNAVARQPDNGLHAEDVVERFGDTLGVRATDTVASATAEEIRAGITGAGEEQLLDADGRAA